MLPIAPSTYFLRKAQQQDLTMRSARARRDDELRPKIQRVWNEHEQVVGAVGMAMAVIFGRFVHL